MENNASPGNFYEEYAATVEVKKVTEKQVDYYDALKRTFDIIFSIISLPFALIFIFIFSIIIKLETSGPIFFSQERVGLNGKYFRVIKLRSMAMDAEKNGAKWATQNDPRVTKVGRFIRKTRIDELPQLFNILKGDMSLIGPRPERPMFTAEFNEQVPGFVDRLSVRPGLSGWAQINGGYDLTPREKLKLDLYYIDNKSFILDLKIVLKTIKVVITNDGAR